MSKQQRAVKISVLSRATSEAVYDVLADLRSHLVWTGSRQTSMYHLEALEAPAGPAQVGTVFSSTGTIPMFVRPALRNLAAMAEKEVAASRAPVSVPVSTIQMQEK